MDDLKYMIEYLINENEKIQKEQFLDSSLNDEEIWRALCNIRDAKDASKEYLEVQDRFLNNRLKKIIITDVNSIGTLNDTFPDANIKNKDKISIWRGDITSLKIDAIVNAANSRGLRMLSATTLLYR